MNLTSDEALQRRRMLRFVMLAVLIWGSVLAMGVLLFGIDPGTGSIGYSPNIWRGLIFEACVLAFVGGWWLLVRTRTA